VDPTTPSGVPSTQPVLAPTYDQKTFLYTLDVSQFTTHVEFLMLAGEANQVFVNDQLVTVSSPVPADGFNYRVVVPIAEGLNDQSIELKPAANSAQRKLLGEEGLTDAGGAFYLIKSRRPQTARLDGIAVVGEFGTKFAVNPTFGPNTYIYTASVDAHESTVNISSILYVARRRLPSPASPSMAPPSRPELRRRSPWLRAPPPSS